MVLIRLELDGSIEKGFRVWLRIPAPEQQEVGKLPNAIKVSQDYTDWQNTYRRIIRGRIKFTPTETPAQVIKVLLSPKTQTVDTTINDWLKADEFKPVEEVLRSQLDKAQVLNKEVRILLQIGEQTELRHFPWSAWKLLSHYDNAEIAISSPSYGKPKQAKIKGRLKILVILGDAKGIDVEVDRQLFQKGSSVKRDTLTKGGARSQESEFSAPLTPGFRLLNSSLALLSRLKLVAFQNLPGKPNVCFLKEPSRQEFHEHLFNQAWDILFFAGHSRTVNQQGLMYLNPQDEVPIAALTQALRESVSRGLKIAIFNSCDGMGFISALEQAQVNIPQMIVMREPVPDRVAQQFLRDFLKAFSGGQIEPKVGRDKRFNRQWLCQQFQSVGQILRSILGLSTATRRPKSFYTAVKSARRELEKLEDEYPAASWLPVIYQNPAVEPPTWAELTRQPDYPRLKLRGVLAVSLVVIGLVMGMRMHGVMQPLELKAYDHLMQTRPIEGPDRRLLVVSVTQTDVDNQPPPKDGSLSNPELEQLIKKLEAHHPRVIGFDIIRNFPTEAAPTLGQRLKSDKKPWLVFPCSHPETYKGDDEKGTAPPPEVSLNRIGFINSPVDEDQVVRRYNFYGKPSDPQSVCKADSSIALVLAEEYIERSDLSTSEKSELSKNFTLHSLGKRAGGYQVGEGLAEDASHTLLNYRPYRKLADFVETVSLRDVLKGDPTSLAKIKDRIILVGRADSDDDRSPTPYVRTDGNASAPSEIPGVYIHAQATSQLLSAILDNRPQIWWLPLWIEALWSGFWALGSVLLLQYTRNVTHFSAPLIYGSVFTLLGLSVYLACYTAMNYFILWAPLVPPLFGILFALCLYFLILNSCKLEE